MERFRGVNCKLKGLSSAVLHVSCHWPYAKVLFIHPPFPKKHLTFLMMQQKASREHASPLNVAMEDTFLQNLLIQKTQKVAPNSSSPVAGIFKDKAVLFKNAHPYNPSSSPWCFGHNALNLFR